MNARNPALKNALKKERTPRSFEYDSREDLSHHGKLHWKFLHVGTIFLLHLPITASLQSDTKLSSSDLEDASIQHAVTPLNPNPDSLPDVKWTPQPKPLTFSPNPTSPTMPSPRPSSPSNSDFHSGTCSAKDSSKPGASRLPGRDYDEYLPCCDPIDIKINGHSVGFGVRVLSPSNVLHTVARLNTTA